MENIYIDCTLFSLPENANYSIEEIRLKSYKAQNLFKPSIQKTSEMVKVPPLSQAYLSIISLIQNINDFKNYPFNLNENGSNIKLPHCLANMFSQDLSIEEIRYYSKVYINFSNPNLVPALYPNQSSSNFWSPFSNPRSSPYSSQLPSQITNPRTGTSSLPTIELTLISP